MILTSTVGRREAVGIFWASALPEQLGSGPITVLS